jgi:hypothetical protein
MRRFAVTITIFVVTFFGCAHHGATQPPSEVNQKEYSAVAVSLSDFSMKITAYYEALKLSIPKDFNEKKFFDVLEEKYPDQSRVKHVRENFKVSVRPLDGGFYSVMLCDPQTDRKIMEDLSCHLNRVEIRSWESNTDSPCIFESNWKPYCE